MSKVNDIKNMKRQQKIITPTQALAESVGEEKKIPFKQENNKPRTKEIENTRNKEIIERRRLSFDIRTDLYKELKMQALLRDEKMYILIEEALEKFFKESK